MNTNNLISYKFDHEAIRDAMDRDLTAPHLAALADPDLPDDERPEVVRTLRALADPRAEAPLLALLRDRAATHEVRESAGWVLDDYALDEGLLEELLAGDRVEGRVSVAGSRDGEAGRRVQDIAADPTHPLYICAIDRLGLGFDLHECHALLIAALRHPDAEARAVAADALLWDEPTGAEEALIAALSDAPEVASAATVTLSYYATRRVMLALEARSAQDDEVGALARERLDGLVDDVMGCLKQTPAMAPWTAPIAHLLPSPEHDETEERRAFTRPAIPPAWSLEQLIRALDEPGGAWREKHDQLRRLTPEAVPPADRPALRDRWSQHPDPEVRHLLCRLLLAWGDVAGLIVLTSDRELMVRKSAIYHLGELPPDASVAPVAWAHLQRPGVTSTYAAETLRTWAHHVGPEASRDTLRRLATEDPRQGVRIEAIELLGELEDREGVQAMVPTLSALSASSAGHGLALAWVARKLGVGREERRALRESDSLYLAQEGWMAEQEGAEGAEQAAEEAMEEK